MRVPAETPFGLGMCGTARTEPEQGAADRVLGCKGRKPHWVPPSLPGSFANEMSAGKWVYHRDGHDLHTRLRHELKQLTGHDLDLSPCFACGKLNTCQVGLHCWRWPCMCCWLRCAAAAPWPRSR